MLDRISVGGDHSKKVVFTIHFRQVIGDCFNCIGFTDHIVGSPSANTKNIWKMVHSEDFFHNQMAIFHSHVYQRVYPHSGLYHVISMYIPTISRL